MANLTRREILAAAGLLATSGLTARSSLAARAESGTIDLHQQLLDRAADFEMQRRNRFAAIKTPEELGQLQISLREKFLQLIGGLPEKAGLPAVRKLGQIEGDDHFVEKLVYESMPGYFVPALLYVPKNLDRPAPGILSPCGHALEAKAFREHQILHVNLARRGFVVLTFDPIGQGERSQFWDAQAGKSKFGLGCPEHTVLGNALELLGTSLARYRIIDGIRGLDYLTSLPTVDAARIGCVGSSGGGTLSAYITALDSRVAAAALCCYITTLPRRMGNRIQRDPSSDPEQDIFGFVSEGIDHAGLMALCAPRPTLVGAATLDFFPIEGTRETFTEATRLYSVANAVDRVSKVEAPFRHGLSLPIREAVYAWFNHWLAGGEPGAVSPEIPFEPRPGSDLLVCADGQANLALGSRHLLPLAFEEFSSLPKTDPAKQLRELLQIDQTTGDPAVQEIKPVTDAGQTLVICINGNDSPDWRTNSGFIEALSQAGLAVAMVDPRGVGKRRADLSIQGRSYTDPLSSVEANIAYNAFLVGQSVLGLRVADVLTAFTSLTRAKTPKRVVLCGRQDAALVACFAAAVDKNIQAVAVEDLLPSYKRLFSTEGFPWNAAGIVPGLLRDFGDIPEVLAEISPRKTLVAAPIGDNPGLTTSTTLQISPTKFSDMPDTFTRWLME